MGSNKELLSRIGFSDGEGKVYEVIMGSENASLQYVHEQTGMERRNVYDIINKLVSKGLVTYFTDNKRKIYRATHPKNILAYFDQQQNDIEKKKELFAQGLPELVKQYEASKPEFNARIYRGKEGIKALFNEMLDYKDHYFIGGNWGIVKYAGREWWDLWDRKRVARKIWWHDIITAAFLAKNPPMKKYYEYRVLPEEFGSPNVILIFGDRLVNLFWGEPLLAFEIENKEISENYLHYFNYLWKRLGKK
jgi:DNA-binding transcriptional regulator GbsR (MarR family)